MKRFRSILLAAGLVLGLTPAMAGAEAGPACADIEGGDGFYVTDGETPTVFAEQQLLAPPCSKFEYRLVVHDTTVTADPVTGLDVVTGTDTVLAETTTYAIDPVTGFQQFTTAVPGGGEYVCLYAEVTTPGGHHQFDRAPDAGCFVVRLDDTGGGGQFGWR